MSMSAKVYGLVICYFKDGPRLQQGAFQKAGCISQIVALTHAEKNPHSQLTLKRDNNGVISQLLTARNHAS